jgi:signal transduction histidine kinase
MALSGWLEPIYFLYGLAFFTLGLVVLLESIRDAPSIAGPRLFRLLGVFALLHALHEWLEILPARGEGGVLDPLLIEWIRAGTLVASFVTLWFYGLGTYRAAGPNSAFLSRFGRLTLPPYAILVLIDVLTALAGGRIDALHAFSGLTRYLIAVPSAALAAIGLRASAARAKSEGRTSLATFLDRRALLFVAYSLTQLLVPSMDTMLAGLLSARTFSTFTGVPVQAVRTLIALGMTWYLFREVLYLEKERKDEKEKAQAERLLALEAEEELRGQLLSHTIRAQEEERARIARELHDEAAQVLTALSLDLGTLKSLLPGNSRTDPLLHRLQDLARRLSQDLYGMVRSLRPAHLDELGLVPALRSLAEREWNPRGISVQVAVEGEYRRLDSLVETALFRAAQEACTNIQRHASAKSAEIRLGYQPGEARLVVTDDGVGFDPVVPQVGPRGFGLAGMRERVEFLGGSLRIDSAPGRGCRLEIRIPTATKEIEA